MWTGLLRPPPRISRRWLRVSGCRGAPRRPWKARIEPVDVRQATAWILFLALFPLAFFWLRRAWRILVRRNYAEVALRRGEPPPNAAHYAPWTGLINLTAGGVAFAVIALVLAGRLAYETWTAIAGTTLWLKLAGDFIVSRHAHPIWKR